MYSVLMLVAPTVTTDTQMFPPQLLHSPRPPLPAHKTPSGVCARARDKPDTSIFA